MYTIKQAASRSGVSVPLLRQWERRYQVVQPARTRSGYRTYDDTAIDRLRLMRALVDDGWTPSMAASHIRGLDDAAVRAAGPRASGVPRPLDSEDDLIEAFLLATASLEVASLEAVLDEMFARGSFETVATLSLMPALRALGAAWDDGRIDVASEHVASGAVLRRLSVAYQAAATGRLDAPVLVGLPPGARHELGALAFAVIARRAGLPVVYLGADLPLADWLRSAAQTNATAAVIGVVSAADVPAAIEVAGALSAAISGLVVAYGGMAAGEVPQDAVGVRLPGDLVEAVGVLRSMVVREVAVR
ncbi:MAG: MerR family transcriptional regulator [Chloroflexi bacterium]|nr:MerR family transcriptional regulator [Chloroflexota bacterium]